MTKPDQTIEKNRFRMLEISQRPQQIEARSRYDTSEAQAAGRPTVSVPHDGHADHKRHGHGAGLGSAMERNTRAGDGQGSRCGHMQHTAFGRQKTNVCGW